MRVTDVTDQSFGLATLRGHMEAGEIEFRARDDENGELIFEIESWARSGDRVFDFLSTTDSASPASCSSTCGPSSSSASPQISGGSAANGIEVYTPDAAPTTRSKPIP